MGTRAWFAAARQLVSKVIPSSEELEDDLDDDLMNGDMELVQVNEAHYVIRFHQLDACSLVFDIDDITDMDLAMKIITVQPQSFCKSDNQDDESCPFYFYISSRIDMDSFKRAVELSQHVTDLTLTLQTVTRDYYFATVYSAMLVPQDKALLNDCIASIVSKPQKFSVVELPLNLQYIDEAARTRQQAMLDTVCVFCQLAKRHAPLVEYFVHPYVPSDSAGKPISMCNTCLVEWEKHRAIAQASDELVLKGEFNEELCALCSDTPKTIVMCSSCVKSFCYTCLIHAMTSEELADMKTNEDWKCLQCSRGVLYAAPLPRPKWTKVEFEKSPFSPYRFERGSTNLQLFEPMAPPLQLAPIDPSVLTGVSAFSEMLCPASPWKQAAQGSATRPAPKPKRVKSKKRPLVVPSVLEVTSKGEEYYFAKYASDSKNSFSRGGRAKPVAAGYTEEVCFLCKDGGDVVECDHVCGDAHCQKVYHEYCLNFKVSNTKRAWVCPRHYCDKCANKSLVVACVYCPFSQCAACVSASTEPLLASSKLVDSSAIGWVAGSDVHTFVCSGCISLAQTAVQNNFLKSGSLADMMPLTLASEEMPALIPPSPLSKKKKKKTTKPSHRPVEASYTQVYLNPRPRKVNGEEECTPWTAEEDEALGKILASPKSSRRGDVRRISRTAYADLLLQPQYSLLLGHSYADFIARVTQYPPDVPAPPATSAAK